MQEQATSSLPSSSERSSSSVAHQIETKEGMESEEESRRVPDFGGGPSGRGALGVEAANKESGSSKGRGKRSAADKEHKRLKRLLRNRVSAQQARERKKAYLTDLEAKVKNLESRNLELEEKLTTLQNENQMLRHILKNTTRRGSGGNTSGGEPSP